MEAYEKRLKDLPQIDKELEKSIKELEMQVEEQETQKQLNNIAIEGLKTELAKLANKVDEKENEIQGLLESEEKTVAREKRYMVQVENLTKKIEATRL